MLWWVVFAARGPQWAGAYMSAEVPYDGVRFWLDARPRPAREPYWDEVTEFMLAEGDASLCTSKKFSEVRKRRANLNADWEFAYWTTEKEILRNRGEVMGRLVTLPPDGRLDVLEREITQAMMCGFYHRLFLDLPFSEDIVRRTCWLADDYRKKTFFEPARIAVRCESQRELDQANRIKWSHGTGTQYLTWGVLPITGNTKWPRLEYWDPDDDDKQARDDETVERDEWEEWYQKQFVTFKEAPSSDFNKGIGLGALAKDQRDRFQKYMDDQERKREERRKNRRKDY